MRYEFRDEVTESVIISDDDNLEFIAAFAHFTQPVEINNCRVSEMCLMAAYFLGGFKLSNCEIYKDVNWQSGGHNKLPIVISNCIFHGFLDLEDSYFRDKVIFANVTFKNGTNFRGNISTPVETSFEKEFILNNVIGQIDLNTSGPNANFMLLPDKSDNEQEDYNCSYNQTEELVATQTAYFLNKRDTP